MNRHLQNLVQRAPRLESILPQITEVYQVLVTCFRDGHKLLLCGNGGSAADCEHWAGELLKGFAQKRPLAEIDRANLPAPLREKLQGALPVIPLTGFLGLSTAFTNDVDAELIYAQLVWALGRPGDVIVGISTSGQARNVCTAMEVAKGRGLIRVGLTGQTGGLLKSLTDYCLCVPETETYLIQEFHLPIYHALSLMLEEEFFPRDIIARP
jgi:D-sedoheptulose 7-phosphate isomerase